MTSCLIITGGNLPALVNPPEADVVVAVDSGLRHALLLGYKVDVLIGDLDSLTLHETTSATTSGTKVISSERAKDFTDFELALDYARTENFTSIVALGIEGGSLDHFLGNIAALANQNLNTLKRSALIGGGTLHLISDSDTVEITGNVGEIVSLMPVGGEVVGVETENLLIPLGGRTLYPWSALGLRNQLVAEYATVSIATGTLAVMHLREQGQLQSTNEDRAINELIRLGQEGKFRGPDGQFTH